MSRAHQHRERGRVERHVRAFILHRDDYACRKCGARGRRLEIDHIQPVSDGGETVPDNLQALCVDCHLAKSRAEAGELPTAAEWDSFAHASRYRKARPWN